MNECECSDYGSEYSEIWHPDEGYFTLHNERWSCDLPDNTSTMILSIPHESCNN